MYARSTIAIVVYQGVSVDEANTFRLVLSRIPNLQTVTVGRAPGQVAGPGGVETAETTLELVGNPEVVAVPGGMGSHRQDEIAAWLTGVSPTWLLASSTGSALLAAAGLLRDATAATHWLAGPLLETYGAHPSSQRVVIDRPIVTCSGGPSTFRAALVVAEAYGGRELAAQIQADVSPRTVSPEPPRRRFHFWPWRRSASTPPRQPHTPPNWTADDIEVVDLGMVTPPRHPGQRTDELP